MYRISFLALLGATAFAHGQEAAGTKEPKVEEVVVTAQKRSERLLDVPLAVTALDADTLAARDQTQLIDYFREVPGLDVNLPRDGLLTILLRGINTGGAANPAFGVVIDDVPIGSSSILGYGDRLVPDLDPADLARVEVLRGPQGTLYGASSLGGLLKYVTSTPSLDEFTGHIEANYDTVDHGDQGFGVRGAVSIPLVTDVLAVSVAGFKRQDPGYVDNVVQNNHDINEQEVHGGRFAALWQISDAVSLRLSALGQNTSGEGSSQIYADYRLEPTLGNLENAQQPGTGRYDIELRNYSATLDAIVGDYRFASITGYSKNTYRSPLDFTSAFWSGLADDFFGVSGVQLVNAFETKKWSQELRLSGATGSKLEWMLGAFYTSEDTDGDQYLAAADAVTGQIQGVLADFLFPTTYDEYAGFANATWHFTDRFDVQVGGRYAENRQKYNETDSGPALPVIGLTDPFVFPRQRADDGSFTFLVAPRFRYTPDLMMYARIASGYRPGGINAQAPLAGLPPTFDPDTTVNYELGVKAVSLDGKLSLDASLYYIDWRDVQLSQQDVATGISFFTNGGKARSMGAEFAMGAAPRDGMTVTATLALDNAELRSDLPPSAGYGFSGDQLPFSAPLTATVGIEQEFRFAERLAAFVGALVSYSGERKAAFPNTLPAPETPIRNEFPSYTTVNLRAGLSYEGWRISFFAQNVGDERGIVAGGPRGSVATQAAPYGYFVVQPRTYGMSFSKDL